MILLKKFPPFYLYPASHNKPKERKKGKGRRKKGSVKCLINVAYIHMPVVYIKFDKKRVNKYFELSTYINTVYKLTTQISQKS